MHDSRDVNSPGKSCSRVGKKESFGSSVLHQDTCVTPYLSLSVFLCSSADLLFLKRSTARQSHAADQLLNGTVMISTSERPEEWMKDDSL